MTFNIGNQTGGVINNVAGDQRVTGGQQGTVVTTGLARDAAANLRAAIQATTLDPRVSAEASARMDEIEAELRTPQPDRSRVAPVLRRLTESLKTAGALAAASVGLIGPLQTLVAWLGDVGAPIAGILARLG